MKILKKLHVLLLLAVLSISGCFTMEVNPVSGNKRMYGYSWSQELQIGKEADTEISAQYGLYDDPKLAAYIDELGQELVKVSHFRREDTRSEYRDIEFTFRVLNSPVVNAFALPGGYVYITRGLISHLENEAQLMVVIGHEIGHVAARHASQRAANQQLGQIAVLGGAILGESLGMDGGNILQLSSQTAQLLFLSYGREDERESDALGVEYSAMLGYDAAEGAALFGSLRRISEKAGASIPSHLSTHPDPGEREKTIPRLASEWAEKGYSQPKQNTDKFMSMADGLMYGDNPREGFVQDGIFYHPDLKFRFPVPQGFTVINEPTAVFLVNDQQNAIIQFTIDSKSSSPQESIEEFLNSDGISVVSQNSLNINGNTGYNAIAKAATEDGTELQLDLTAISFNGNIYQFLSYTLAEQFNTYAGRFGLVREGFNALTNQAILNIEPVRLSVTKAPRTAAFRNLLPAKLPMDIDPADIAILNQVELGDTIQQGAYIKIPVQPMNRN